MFLTNLEGKEVTGRIIKIYAAVGNTDNQSGNGQKIDRAYFYTEKEAEIGAEGKGVFGSKADIEARWAILFPMAGHVALFACSGRLPISSAPEIHFAAIDVERITAERKEAARQRALAKLNEDDKEALGLVECMSKS